MIRRKETYFDRAIFADRMIGRKSRFRMKIVLKSK